MHVVRNSTMVQIIRSAKDAGYKAHSDTIEGALKVVLDDHSKLERENKNLEQAATNLLRTVDQLVDENQELIQRLDSEMRKNQSLKLNLNQLYGNIANGVYADSDSMRTKAFCVMVRCSGGTGTKHVLTSDESLETCVTFLATYVREAEDCPNCEYTIEEF